MSNINASNLPANERFPYPLQFDGTPEGVLDAPLNWICVSSTGTLIYRKTTGLGVKTGWVQSSASDFATVGAQNARTKVTAVYTLNGTALHALASGIDNVLVLPADAIILRVLLNVTTIATAACTLDIGYSTTTLTTSDTFLDGVDVNAAAALFDSMNAGLDTGTNAFAQKAASGKFITVDEKTGNATGLIGTIIVEYILQ